MSRTEKESRKKRLFRFGCAAVLLGIGASVIIFLIANALVGYFLADRLPHNTFRLHLRYDIEFIPGKVVTHPVHTYYKGRVAYGKEGLTYEIKINSLGFRGPETSAESTPGVLRIVCMGDSSTFGWAVDENMTFVRRLETILNTTRPGNKYETVNLGVYSHSSHYGRILFEERGLALKPSIVTIAYGTNDPLSVGNRPHTFARAPDKIRTPIDYEPSWRDIAGNGILNRLALPLLECNLSLWARTKIADRIWAGGGAKKPGKEPVPEVVLRGNPPRVEVEDYRENLRAMAKMTIESGAQPLFIAFNLIPEYDGAMRDVAREFGAPFLSDSEIYERHRDEALNGEEFEKYRAWSEDIIGKKRLGGEPVLYFKMDRAHPSPLGHELIARELAAVISEMEIGKEDDR